MTNRNSILNSSFLLSPVGKNYIWGGSRLNDDFSKNIELTPLAETWECSTHPDGFSIVANGKNKGKTLKSVLQMFPEYLGRFANTDGELPILIKLIDAKEDLSVQVHPDDEYAGKNENEQLGKTEAWYILDTEDNSKLVYGLNNSISKEMLSTCAQNGEIEKYLQKISVKKNDVFMIKPGTIHAIGAGILLAEIQENSNLTYRLYDYNRTDKNGKKRALHIEKAVDVASVEKTEEPKQPLRVLQYYKGGAKEFICRCKYFEISRMIINTERCRDLVSYRTDDSSFRVLLCIEGCGAISQSDDNNYVFFKGDCIFVPANCTEMKIHGKAQFLEVRC